MNGVQNFRLLKVGIHLVLRARNSLHKVEENKKGANSYNRSYGIAPFCNDVRRRSTLPQGPPCSTIDAERLSFRVRNGTGRFPLAMAAETLLSYQSVAFLSN